MFEEIHDFAQAIDRSESSESFTSRTQREKQMIFIHGSSYKETRKHVI